MLVGIMDLPDQESAGALNLAVQASGAVSSVRVTPLISHTEAVRLYERAGSVGYQPPA
jgi:hypothetical protein